MQVRRLLLVYRIFFKKGSRCFPCGVGCQSALFTLRKSSKMGIMQLMAGNGLQPDFHGLKLRKALDQ
jgi:hypothetical protein